jgi:isoleucyl-tRNA synthetase
MSEEKGSDLPQKSSIAKREEEVLAFWDKEKIFKQSVDKDAPKGEYVFYDGPPFATGLPHFGHILQSAIKDVIPRYRTMQGYRVVRRWGWDCHGLPLENIIEGELGIKTKREIEELGIAKFNEAARSAVLRYADDWKHIIPRMGRWVDMEDDYKTMDTTYTESVWWSFKNLFDRGLIYEGFKGMLLCPRCGTTLSNFEVAQGYKDIEDISIYVKFPIEGEANTSLLVWTTTPWTMPGNAAAAVHKDATYVKAEVNGEFLILAKDRLVVLGDAPKIISEFPGKDLVGKRYTPPFPFYTKKDLKGKNKAWKIYHADYVSMEDGTGAVHLAPSYGAIDQELAEREGIPLIHHVNADGRFAPEVEGFAGLQVKPKGHHQDADKKIVEALEAMGVLFKHDTIVHSYPHCWRCDTPLINYAASSWFVKVSALKQKLVAENKGVQWVPDHTGSGRFNNLLETAPDWAISRSRYWGAPLPVWRNEKTGKVAVVGSIDDLLSMTKKSGNTYVVMRHGEARSNVERFMNSDNTIENHLTERGRAVAKASVEAIAKKYTVDLIVASPITRASETATIAQHVLGLPDTARMTDERLRERGMGEYNGKPRGEWVKMFNTMRDDFTTNPGNSESLTDVRKRIGDFIFEVERRYTNKVILIVTHGDPAWMLAEIAQRTPIESLMGIEIPEGDVEGAAYLPHYLTQGAWMEVPFVPFPHNPQFDVDLHRPYIDDITWGDPITGVWKRVPEVFDCWYESGSMPYAQNHYPFANTDQFNPKRLLSFSPKGYPADFIAEAVDQTRGWFYSLIVLGYALFGRAPYKHVITTGFVLAEDGRKMSKKLKNYPDPMELVDQYGADAMRYYMLASPLVRGEDLNFSARGVDEVAKKLIMRLDNVRSFLGLYADGTAPNSESAHVLDRWILARLGALVRETTEGFEAYQLDAAVRPLGDFIDDLSTWYLRRSRDRFKGDDAQDKTAALATLRYVLIELSKVMAPTMPFYAEHLYRLLKAETDTLSVHLCAWPSGAYADAALLQHMQAVRDAVSLALEARAKANIKVRQPLASITLRGTTIPQETAYMDLIREEVNVKEVVFEAAGEGVVLDMNITPELKQEGLRRDVGRLIQEFRKQSGLTVSDRPTLRVGTNSVGKKFIEEAKALLVHETGLADITLTDAASDAPPHKDVGFPIELSL